MSSESSSDESNTSSDESDTSSYESDTSSDGSDMLSSLKMSCSKIQIKHKGRKQLAERHGDLIISMMSKFAKHRMLGPANKNRKGRFEFKDVPDWKEGLLVFYLVSNEDENDEDPKRPVYVGKTRRAFRDRFKDKDLHHIFEWFDKDENYEFDLYVVICKLPYPLAAFMKELFLEEFNFIRNRVGSDCKRDHLDDGETYSRKQSLERIKKQWRDTEDALGDLVDIGEYNTASGLFRIKQFAEKHGDLIISMMRKFAKHRMLGPAEKNKKGKFEFKHVPDWKEGICVYYLVPKKDKDPKRPVYVGTTRRSFRDRLKDKDLNHIFECFDEDKFDLYVIVCKLSYPYAAFMKELFLVVFNFFRNRVGSDYKRDHLDYGETYSKKQSWKMIKGEWRDKEVDSADLLASFKMRCSKKH